jgi:hypothetical protein
VFWWAASDSNITILQGFDLNNIDHRLLHLVLLCFGLFSIRLEEYYCLLVVVKEGGGVKLWSHHIIIISCTTGGEARETRRNQSMMCRGQLVHRGWWSCWWCEWRSSLEDRGVIAKTGRFILRKNLVALAGRFFSCLFVSGSLHFYIIFYLHS